MNADIIIIGAGISGLVAANELGKKGLKVLVLEARDRIGGRIYTLNQNEFSVPMEGGAEFMHGELELTQELIKQSGDNYFRKSGLVYRKTNGEIKPVKELIENFDFVLRKLKEQKDDISLDEFVGKNFNSEKDEVTINSLFTFVENYENADPHKVSILTLKNEWSESPPSIPYQLSKGYGSIINYLHTECTKNNCEVLLSHIVKEINWKKGEVEVICKNKNIFRSPKILNTIPLGVFKANSQVEAFVHFFPDISEKINASRDIGFGSALKIILEFKDPFWSHKSLSEPIIKTPQLALLISNEVIPVWWTKDVQSSGIITGWKAGPKVEALKYESEADILNKALVSLANIFNTRIEILEPMVYSSTVVNWAVDPFTLGAYAYEMPGSKRAKKIISEPVEQTLFFAGEALYSGEAMGTVEAAIASAMETVTKILNTE